MSLGQRLKTSIKKKLKTCSRAKTDEICKKKVFFKCLQYKATSQVKFNLTFFMTVFITHQ